MNFCPCGSGKYFEECCKLLITLQAQAKTAEELMRSRYTAYVTVNTDYIIKTTHPSTRKQYSPLSITKWAKSSKWIKLEILSTELGKESDLQGTVSFKAYYLDQSNKPVVHHEHSTFIKEKGIWYFKEGEVR